MKLDKDFNEFVELFVAKRSPRRRVPHPRIIWSPRVHLKGSSHHVRLVRAFG
jgi:hypothetical protein